MKPYGIPRVPELDRPDCVDIQRFGLKSSKSRVKNKSGVRKNSFRNVSAKRRTRRYWKKRERMVTQENLRRCRDYYVEPSGSKRPHNMI